MIQPTREQIRTKELEKLVHRLANAVPPPPKSEKLSGKHRNWLCHLARRFLPQIADPLRLIPHRPKWLTDHLESCQYCQVELENLGQVGRIIEYAQTDQIPKEPHATTTAHIIEQARLLQAIEPEEVTCDWAKSYYWHMAICELKTYAPPERYRHAMDCNFCKEKINWLRDRIGITAPQIGTSQFEQLWVDVFQGPRVDIPDDFRQQPMNNELQKFHDLDCRMVRPFLKQLANPLELVRLPHWLAGHVQICKDCWREYKSLERFRKVVDATETLILRRASGEKKLTARNLCPDAKPKFIERVEHEAQGCHIDKACFPASRFYHDLARCDLESPADVSDYLHVRSCPYCAEHVRQLYYRLGMAVPRFATPEFEKLQATVSKGLPVPVPTAPKISADHVGSPEFFQLRDHLNRGRLG